MADAHTPGFGTTGGTSVPINNFADTTFSEAEKAFGARYSIDGVVLNGPADKDLEQIKLE